MRYEVAVGLKLFIYFVGTLYPDLCAILGNSMRTIPVSRRVVWVPSFRPLRILVFHRI